jgi:cytoskeletal protein RodZ
MKNDTTTTFLNFVLAVLVILGVVFALWSIQRTVAIRRLQPNLQTQLQAFQATSAKAQALLNDVIKYNATAKSPELAQIIQAAETPAQPITK